MRTFRYWRKSSVIIFNISAIATAILMVLVCNVSAQNVGIGVENPTEKLQVNGIVHSVSDGFRFPDGSVQSTASYDFEPQQAGDDRWIIIMKIAAPSILGSFSFDTLQNVIKIIDYQWNVTFVPPPPSGGTGELTVGNIRIMKNIDLATNFLLPYLFNGANLNEIRLYFYRHVETGVQLYYTFIFNEITITGFDQAMHYRGGEAFSHVDIFEFQFQEGYWEYNDGAFGSAYHWPGQ